MTVQDPFRNLLALRHRIAAHARGVVERHPGALACRRGCAACCDTERVVADIEYDRLARAIEGLAPSVRARLGRREDGACPLLLDGACAVYAERPLVCRAHGLPVAWEGGRDVCPLNFEGRNLEDLADEDLLSLERVTTLAVVINALYCEETGGDPDRRRPVGKLLAPG